MIRWWEIHDPFEPIRPNQNNGMPWPWKSKTVNKNSPLELLMDYINPYWNKAFFMDKPIRPGQFIFESLIWIQAILGIGFPN